MHNRYVTRKSRSLKRHASATIQHIHSPEAEQRNHVCLASGGSWWMVACPFVPPPLIPTCSMIILAISSCAPVLNSQVESRKMAAPNADVCTSIEDGLNRGHETLESGRG